MKQPLSNTDVVIGWRNWPLTFFWTHHWPFGIQGTVATWKTLQLQAHPKFALGPNFQDAAQRSDACIATEVVCKGSCSQAVAVVGVSREHSGVNSPRCGVLWNLPINSVSVVRRRLFQTNRTAWSTTEDTTSISYHHSVNRYLFFSYLSYVVRRCCFILYNLKKLGVRWLYYNPIGLDFIFTS